jgi:hypothetical protein
MLQKSTQGLSAQKFNTLLLFAALWAGVCGWTQAAVSVQQTPITGGNAIFANASAGAVNADNFSLASATSLQSLSWWGSYDGADTDHFVVKIYANNSGVPGSVLNTNSNISVSKTPSGINDSASAAVYRYDYSLPQTLALAAGSYFLSITNETSQHSWFWLTGSGGDSQHKALATNGNTWSLSVGSDLAFTVTSTNPAPAATSVPIPAGFLVVMMASLAYLGKRIRRA